MVPFVSTGGPVTVATRNGYIVPVCGLHEGSFFTETEIWRAIKQGRISREKQRPFFRKRRQRVIQTRRQCVPLLKRKLFCWFSINDGETPIVVTATSQARFWMLQISRHFFPALLCLQLFCMVLPSMISHCILDGRIAGRSEIASAPHPRSAQARPGLGALQGSRRAGGEHVDCPPAGKYFGG